MPRTPLPFFALGALTVPALTLLAPGVATAQAPERYTLRGADAAVYDPAGRVQVVAGSGSDVIVEVTRRGRDAGQLRVLTGQVRGQDAVRIVAPAGDLVYPALGRRSSTSFDVRSDGTFGDDDGGSSSRASDGRLTVRGDGGGPEAWAEVIVRVPAGRRVTVQVGAGSAAAQGVDADLRLGTRGGDVTAERTRGRLVIGSGSGDVHVRGAQGSELRVGTGSGDVEVRDLRAERIDVGTGSGDVNGGGLDGGDVKLAAGSGDFKLDAVRARTLRIGTGSGSADVGVAGPLEEARVGSGSGDVTLRVPANFGATLDVSTGSGDVHSDLPLQVTRADKHHITGRIGDGRAAIHVSSGSGDVRVVPVR